MNHWNGNVNIEVIITENDHLSIDVKNICVVQFKCKNDGCPYIFILFDLIFFFSLIYKIYLYKSNVTIFVLFEFHFAH